MTFDITVLTSHWQSIIYGFGVTLLFIAISIPLSVLGGLLLALARMSRYRLLVGLSRLIVIPARNIPFLVQVFLVFYTLPAYDIDFGTIGNSIICLTLYGSAYLSETLRGAIEAIPAGQTEAGRALGLNYYQRLRHIILPQIPPYFLPAATNIFITLSKETALLSLATAPELTYQIHTIVGYTYSPIEPYLLLALVYWGTSESIAKIMRMFESKYKVKYS